MYVFGGGSLSVIDQAYFSQNKNKVYVYLMYNVLEWLMTAFKSWLIGPSVADPGFLERGFVCTKVWGGFLLLILFCFYLNIP